MGAQAPNGQGKDMLNGKNDSEDYTGDMAPLDQPPWVKTIFRFLPGLRVNLIAFYSTLILTPITLLVTGTGLDKFLAGPANIAISAVAAALGWLFGAKGNYRVIKNPQGNGDLAVARVSMINAADPYFLPPHLPEAPRPLYDPLEFPKTDLPDDGYGFNEYNVHFLSLCMKVAYESTQFIKDVVETDLKWTFEKAIWTDVSHAPPEHKAVTKFLPETRAFVVSNANAAVLIFRGTEPLNLANWFSDGNAKMERRPGGAYGYVHTGFYEAFFYGSDSKSGSIFDQIIKELSQSQYKHKALYVTGHSLGGALVTMFAHCLAFRAGIPSRMGSRHKDGAVEVDADSRAAELAVYKRIMATDKGGVYTFAGPRAGNYTFTAYIANCFPGKVFRLVHSSDLVPKVPTIDLAFRHHPKEYYLTTFGYLLEDPEDIEKWRARESTGINFAIFYWYKILAGFFYYRENFLRTIERVAFFFLAPGFTDHWPSDYEFKLRNVALNTTADGIVDKSKAGNAARRRPRIIEDKNTYHFA